MTFRSTSSPNGCRRQGQKASPAFVATYSPWGCRPVSLDRSDCRRIDPEPVAELINHNDDANGEGNAFHGKVIRKHGKGRGAHV